MKAQFRTWSVCGGNSNERGASSLTMDKGRVLAAKDLVNMRQHLQRRLGPRDSRRPSEMQRKSV